MAWDNATPEEQQRRTEAGADTFVNLSSGNLTGKMFSRSWARRIAIMGLKVALQYGLMQLLSEERRGLKM